MIVSALADPPSKVAEALEVLAGDLFEQFSHVGHKLEWHQFFYIRPLTGLPFGHYREEFDDGHVPLVLFQGAYLCLPTAADEMGEIAFPPRGHKVGHPVCQTVIGSAPSALLGSLGGGSAPLLPALRPLGRGPPSGTFSFSGRVSVILAGTGGGTRFGGRAFRWEHLLLIRCCLRRFPPSGGRRLLLRRPRPRLSETRSGWHLRRGLWFAAPANASSCQQVLHSERRQCVHGLDSGRCRR